MTGLVDTESAAQFLSLAPKTLAHMRCRGDGPPYVRVNARIIRYRLADLEAWAGAHIVNSTSEGAPA